MVSEIDINLPLLSIDIDYRLIDCLRLVQLSGMSVEVIVLAIHSDALGGSSRVFSPAIKRLDERLRDEPKVYVWPQSVFLESPEKALDVRKKARADFNVGYVWYLVRGGF